MATITPTSKVQKTGDISPARAPPQLLPENDFLEKIRKHNPSIPADYFSGAEEVLIRSMFQRQLIASLNLIDLLGFEFHSAMEALILANQEMSNTKGDSNPLLEEFCKGYFAFFIRLFRDRESQKSPNPIDPSQGLLLKLEDFGRLLEALCKTLNEQSRTGFQRALGSKQKPDLEVLKTKYGAALGHSARLSDLKNLWVKIISSPFCSFFLIDSSVSNFPGSEQLHTTAVIKTSESPLSSLPSLSSILRFFDFLAKCALHGGRLFGGTYDFIWRLQRFLISYKDQPITQSFIQEWHKEIHSVTAGAISIRLVFQNELLQARNGALTHRQWLNRHQMKASQRKTQEEFVEGLNFTLINLLINEAWLEDIYRIVELQIVIPYFPSSYRTKHKTLTQIFQNLFTLPSQEQEKKPTLPRTSILPKEISEAEAYLQEEIKKACQPFYDLINQPELKAFILFVRSRESIAEVSYSAVYSNLFRLCSSSSLMEQLETQLVQIQRRYHEQLMTFVKTVPPRHRAAWIQEVVENCSNQVSDVFFILTTFNDIKTILERFTFIEDLDYLIHPAVRDFLRLPADVQDQLKTTLYEAPAQPPPPLEDARPDQKTDQPDYQALLNELKTATKRREFKKALKKLRFFFLRHGTGSHEIWSSFNGTTVVLPFHNGSDPLKPGTHQAIVKQVATSFKSD